MAIHVPNQDKGFGQELFNLFGADMNVTTDQPFAIAGGSLPPFYTIDFIRVSDASTSLTTAAGGIYDTASKGGTPLVAAAQAYSALTGATLGLDLTIAAYGKGTRSAIPILALTTPQGGAATANIRIYGRILSR